MSAAAGGGYTSRKFVTEELLTKLNTLLEQIARQQPPINPSVDAYKQEHDKVEYYLNELKKNPDDHYLRAQLHQAMDDRQHLYNLIQGNKNPFKTETSTSEGTQTQTQINTGVQTTKPQEQSTGTQSDVVSEMERIREMFRTPAAETDKPEKATFKGYKKKSFRRPYSPPPSYHTQTPRPKSSPESIPRPIPKPTPRRTSTPRRKPPFNVPRRLVTGVRDWYN